MAKLCEICELPTGWVADNVAPTKRRCFVPKANGRAYDVLYIGRRRCAEMNIEGASEEVIAEIGRKSALCERTVIVRVNGEWAVRKENEGCPKFVMKGKKWREISPRKYVSTEQAIKKFEEAIDAPIMLKRRRGEGMEQYRQRESDALFYACAGKRFRKRVSSHDSIGVQRVTTTKRFANSRITCVCKSVLY